MKRTRREWLALAVAGTLAGLPFHARFVDVRRQAGLRQAGVYGGVAFIDYDNDGWPNIFVLSGTRFGGALAGTFMEVTEKAELVREGWASAVRAGDYNNSGFPDLFVTHSGQNILYRNNGDGTFTDVTREAGLTDPKRRWGAGCTFIDYDRDGHLDLFVMNYVDFDPARVPKPGRNSFCSWTGISVNCGPLGLPPGRHSLYRNNGDGTFTDVTAASGVGKAKGSYGMTAPSARWGWRMGWR